MQRREVIYALPNEPREIKTQKDLFLPLYVQMLSLLLGVVHTPDVDGVPERLSTVFQLRSFCLILGPMSHPRSNERFSQSSVFASYGT